MVETLLVALLYSHKIGQRSKMQSREKFVMFWSFGRHFLTLGERVQVVCGGLLTAGHDV
jgi:hypothetical protein